MSFAVRTALIGSVLFAAVFTHAHARADSDPASPSIPTAESTAHSESIVPEPDFDEAFESTHFSGSANCSSCHDDLRDRNGEDVSLVRDWSATMMAHAARDPVFQAKVASEIKRHPELEEVISEKCLRCHAPMAGVDADYDGNRLTLLDDEGILDPDNPYHSQAMEGVGCTACHQIEDNELGELSSFSGGFDIPTIDEKWQRVSYGQYESPVTDTMQRQSGFTAQHAAHMDDSAMCATCHNLNTPVVNSDGVVISTTTGHEFPEQAVYTEWQNSDYADNGANPQSCQDCHMPSADGVRIATRPRRLAPVDDFKRHLFAGANTVVLDMLDKNRDELGVTTSGIADAVDTARGFLKTSAELRLVSAERSDGTLDVELEVINLSGHKLPTGYPSRRVWIDFQVVDANRQQLFRSGEMHADGRIEGIDDAATQVAYQPHHRLISEPSQVQVYETVMGDTDEALTHTLLSANAYLKDNRLTPSGFDKHVATDDIAVIGEAMTDDDFNNGSDTVVYRVPIQTDGPVTIKAALRYQPLSANYLQDLFTDADLALVARLQRLWATAAVRAETLAEVELQIVQ